MSVTPDSFRQSFPAFANAVTFPDTEVQFYLDLAGNLLNADRWGSTLYYGIQLFVAHHLALDAVNNATAQASGIPGQVQGPIASKSVDKVSVSKDFSAVMEQGAGYWNATNYGQRYFRLSRMMGAGGIQLGTCPA